MTKPKTPAPAEALGGFNGGERLVAARADELAIIERDIASAESRRRELLVGDDDTAYESAEIALERLGRKRHRAFVRLEVARTEHAEAKASEKEARRAALYEAGRAAAIEVERLVEEYEKRAAAVVETLREIAAHAEAIKIADDNRAPYTQWLDSDSLRIGGSVVLPASTQGGGYIWPSDEIVPEAAENSTPAAPRVYQPASQQEKQYGEHVSDDGSRRIVLPVSDWGTPREYVNTESQSRSFDAN